MHPLCCPEIVCIPSVARSLYAYLLRLPPANSTTVTAALDEVFPEARTASADVLAALVAGNGPAMRTPSGFNAAARKALRTLRGRKGEASQRAARELGTLLADTELFESYRAALLET